VDRVVDGEERWHTLGMVGGDVNLLVVPTIEEQNGEEVRVIPARKAVRASVMFTRPRTERQRRELQQLRDMPDSATARMLCISRSRTSFMDVLRARRMLTSCLIGLLETASPNIRWQGLHWGRI
jgi:hypothetical protein